MRSTDLTVAAVVVRGGRYLIVEETAGGRIVLSQPGGHIEGRESPEQAVVREVLEETGCTVSCDELIGVYLWIHPRTAKRYLRLVYSAEFLGCDDARLLDDSIVARHWLTRDELIAARARLRTPVVSRCIQDFEAGRREPQALVAGMLPLQSNFEQVLARAYLV